MKLYLDDDIAKRALVARLKKQGHHVVVPADVGTSGAADPRHLIHAVQSGSVLLSKNYKDFLHLHDLVQATNGGHAGLLLVRLDNDPSRDMKDRDIVRAIANLEQSGVAGANELHVLNHWR